MEQRVAAEPNIQSAQVLDDSPLTARYWLVFGLLAASLILEFYDFFIVSFLVAVLAAKWTLTIGEVSIVLISAGIGGIVGGLGNGALSDRIGRKWILIVNTILVAAASGFVALLPDGDWQLFAVLRFVVGFGIGGVTVATGPLLVEFTPARRRALLVGLAYAGIPAGTLSASLLAAYLLPVAGWRVVAALGAVPILLALVMIFVVPESARWLLAQGRRADAQRVVDWMAGRHVALSTELSAPPAPAASSGYGELLGFPRSFWLVAIVWSFGSTAAYGVLLWGPTVLAQLLSVDPHVAAKGFIFVSLAGIAGRLTFAAISTRIGRVRAGQAMGLGAAALLTLAAILHAQFFFGVSAFLLCLVAAQFFLDGGWSSVGPHTSEVVPVRLSARSVGVSQMGSAIGKIVGPACLGIISGTGNLVTPRATADAVFPAFLFLAACSAVIAIMYTIVPIETRAKTLQ